MTHAGKSTTNSSSSSNSSSSNIVSPNCALSPAALECSVHSSLYWLARRVYFGRREMAREACSAFQSWRDTANTKSK